MKEEVSASLWGILLTGQQVQDSLTCCLHQLCECVCVHVVCVGECMYVYEHGETKWQTARALGKLTDPGKTTGDSGEPKTCRLLPQSFFLLKKLFVSSWILKAKGLLFWGLFVLFFSQVKKGPLD